MNNREQKKPMQKRQRLFLLLCGAAAMLAFSLVPVFTGLSAEGETARNLSKKCKFSSNAGGAVECLYDNNYSASFRTIEKIGAALQVTLPRKTPCQGISIHWGQMTSPFAVQVKNGSDWVTVHEGEVRYAHEFIALEQVQQFRILVGGNEKGRLSIAELLVYGPGNLPRSAQRWEDPPNSADLMLIVAHPDDEFIFMGGTIPYYAVERGKDVVVVYMTCGNRLRLHELLKGLWAVGYTYYPIVGDFKDRYCIGVEKGFHYWDKQQTADYLADLYRQYQPKVVVTHDLNGEYNHGNHCATSHSAVLALERGADASYRSAYDPYQVRKLYLHLYPENAMYMDWSMPLTSFGGKTAIEVAAHGFAAHASQRGGSVTVRGEKFVFGVYLGGLLDNGAFGLYASNVGPDIWKNDFFENIE